MFKYKCNRSPKIEERRKDTETLFEEKKIVDNYSVLMNDISLKGQCYGLNACVPPKFICGTQCPQPSYEVEHL